jgi:hypothetical protein
MQMRILLGLAIAAMTLWSGTQPSAAAEPRPYCLNGKSTGSIPDCSYYTWEQCLAAITGGADGCSENPELAWRALERGRAQPRPRSQRGPQRY